LGIYEEMRLSRIPFFKLLAILQILLLARRHLLGLSAAERRRLTELVRNGHHLSGPERRELRELAGKLQPGAFAFAAADRLSPIGVPGRRKRASASGR
jgi:hypothetical protein